MRRITKQCGMREDLLKSIKYRLIIKKLLLLIESTKKGVAGLTMGFLYTTY